MAGIPMNAFPMVAACAAAQFRSNVLDYARSNLYVLGKQTLEEHWAHFRDRNPREATDALKREVAGLPPEVIWVVGLGRP